MALGPFGAGAVDAVGQWMASAKVGEGGLLVPAVRLCVQHWSWRPNYIVVDMGYLAAAHNQICRQRWQEAVLTDETV